MPWLPLVEVVVKVVMVLTFVLPPILEEGLCFLKSLEPLVVKRVLIQDEVLYLWLLRLF